MNAISPYSPSHRLAKLDGRTKEARLMRDTRANLVAHVGGKPSTVQALLIDRAVQLVLRIATLDRKFSQMGEMTEHDSRTYLAWSNSLSRTLALLGLSTPARSRMTAAEALAARDAARAAR